MEFEVLPY